MSTAITPQPYCLFYHLFYQPHLPPADCLFVHTPHRALRLREFLCAIQTQTPTNARFFLSEWLRSWCFRDSTQTRCRCSLTMAVQWSTSPVPVRAGLLTLCPQSLPSLLIGAISLKGWSQIEVWPTRSFYFGGTLLRPSMNEWSRKPSCAWGTSSVDKLKAALWQGRARRINTQGS